MLAAISDILSDDFQILGASLNGEMALRNALVLRPDVIVLDISMRGLNGLQVAHLLRELGCTAKVVVLSMHEDRAFVDAAFQMGAKAYVYKSAVERDLVEAVHSVGAGELFVSAGPSAS
jgi:DNA-binding NarL/FixJ family response regulator